MKASEVIASLQNLMEEHGDKEVDAADMELEYFCDISAIEFDGTCFTLILTM